MPHVHRSDAHGGYDAWAATYDRSGLQGLFFDRVGPLTSPLGS
jgi:hypothetical protein